MAEQQTVQKITKDSTIGDIVKNHPSCIEVLLSYGVHCVGCHVSYEESLEQGFRGHGLSDEEISEAVEKLNQTIASQNNVSGETVKITEKALGKLKEILSQQNKLDHGLRIKVVTGGCAGFMYEFSLEKQSSANDKVIEETGVKFFLDLQSFQMLKGAKIDYVDSLQGAGFRVTNPNAASTCGCGHSFG